MSWGRKFWHRSSDIGGCGLNWAGPGSLDHERHYAMISDVSPSLSLSSSLSLSPRYWQYGPRKGNILQRKELQYEEGKRHEWIDTARRDWDDKIIPSQASWWWNVPQVWSFDPIFEFDWGQGSEQGQRGDDGMMSACLAEGDLEQNTLIFNPNISGAANLFPENSHAVLNYFSASYVICS